MPREGEPSVEEQLEHMISEVEIGDARRKIIDKAQEELAVYRNNISLDAEGKDISPDLKRRAGEADVELQKLAAELEELISNKR